MEIRVDTRGRRINARVQASDDGGLNESGKYRNGERWLDSK